MGNKCGCGNEMTPEQHRQLIKIQGAVRTMLAVIRKNRMKEQKLRALFTIDKRNHKKNETMMLTQRIGALNYDQYAPKDGEPRTYYDKFVDEQVEGQTRTYKGQWHKHTQKKDGMGILFFEDGTKYEGNFRNGHMSGNGRKLFVNGEYYEGEFLKDQANGIGTFRDLYGGRYEGYWKNDKQHGHGKEIWNNGAEIYYGEFFEGKKHGKGKFMWQDGSFYEGDFQNGLFNGFGVYYFKESEKTYTGQFVDGKIEGEGEMVWEDGRNYNGQFKDGKEDGEGTFRWPNGNTYIGKFKEGKMSGYAIFLNMEEYTKRHGEWKEGKRIQWLSSPEHINVNQSPIKKSSYVKAS